MANSDIARRLHWPNVAGTQTAVLMLESQLQRLSWRLIAGHWRRPNQAHWDAQNMKLRMKPFSTLSSSGSSTARRYNPQPDGQALNHQSCIRRYRSAKPR